MRVIYRKIRHARYLYIKRSVEKVWGARYLSKNMVSCCGSMYCTCLAWCVICTLCRYVLEPVAIQCHMQDNDMLETVRVIFVKLLQVLFA